MSWILFKVALKKVLKSFKFDLLKPVDTLSKYPSCYAQEQGPWSQLTKFTVDIKPL